MVAMPETEPIEHTTPQPQAPAPVENSAMREMRTALEAANARAKALEDENKAFKKGQTDAERAKLEENERLKLEVSERDAAIEGVKGQLERLTAYEATFKGLYESEIAKVPEAHRETIAGLSAVGDWPDRLAALQKAVTLIPAEPGTIRQSFGLPGNVGSVPQPPNVPQKLDPAKAGFNAVPWKT